MKYKCKILADDGTPGEEIVLAKDDVTKYINVTVIIHHGTATAAKAS